MTTFTHRTTGAALTYPQGHPLHQVLTSSDQWQATTPGSTKADEVPEAAKEVGDGADAPKPAARRSRGRTTTTAD